MILFLIACSAAFFLGAVPNAYIIGTWLKGVDLRKEGSGNVGATNAFRVLGKRIGMLILILDMLKGFVPAMFFVSLFSVPNIGLHQIDMAFLVGLAAVLGHIFTPFLNFKGGKGIATSIGVFLAVVPLAMLIMLGIIIPVIVLTRIVSIGSLTGAFLMPPLIKIFHPDASLLFYLTILLSLLIVYRHRDNIKRLLKGAEKKFF